MPLKPPNKAITKIIRIIILIDMDSLHSVYAGAARQANAGTFVPTQAGSNEDAPGTSQSPFRLITEGGANCEERDSMTKRFLISVAAATLIAGTGFANAQGTGMGRDSPSGGGATQQGGATEQKSDMKSEQTSMASEKDQ